MKHVIIAIISLLTVLYPLVSHPQEIEMLDGNAVVANTVLVKAFNNSPIISEVEEETINNHGVRRLRSHSLSTAELLERLNRNPNVEYAEPDYIVTTDNTPNDPLFWPLWGLENTGQALGTTPGGVPGADIDAIKAWDKTVGDPSIVVGVIDTGIDELHPDLIANLWSAPSAFSVKIGTLTINCPAGSHGFNGITNTCLPVDDNRHGTHCAGTIGAVGDDSLGVVGVNWDTSIMALKFIGANGSGSVSDAIKTMEFALQVKKQFPETANIRVLSNSWGGGGFSQTLLNEINAVGAANMLFVAAAGNSGLNTDVTPHYPSAYNSDYVVSVAATDNKDLLASFSNYGVVSVDLGAPGVKVYSTVPGGEHAYLSGTSMATPHVSGAAALVLSVCDLDSLELRSVLEDSTDPLDALNGKTASGGRLNVNNAINSCLVVPPKCTPTGCNDNNACTNDTCNPAVGCEHAAITCDDSNVCTNNLCDVVNGCQFPPKDMEDGDLCTIDSCNPVSGFKHEPINCADDKDCSFDSCDKGICFHDLTTCACIEVVDCDDLNSCTTDDCDDNHCTNTDNGTCTLPPPPVVPEPPVTPEPAMGCSLIK